MDIKGITRNLIPLATLKSVKESANTRSKTDANNDRDGDGAASGEEHKRQKLNPEEISEAVDYLKELPGVKENNLTVRLETSGGTAVVYIQDLNGKVIRRIPESELAALTSNRQRKSGHLLNKAL